MNPLKALLLATLLLTQPARTQPARAQTPNELRIGMTIADIPTAKGAPDQGGEGIRWMGFTIYDSLLYWDLLQEKTIPDLVPALATKWYPNPADPKEWIIELRHGVTFHDGSPFDAGSVIWNLEKLLTPEAPQYDREQKTALGFRIPGVKHWRRIDDFTLGISDDAPNADIPQQIVFLHISSPAQWTKLGGWTEFAKHPSGTGPFIVQEIVPRQRAVLLPNKAYWDIARRPKVDRLVLLPIPDANTRVAALLSNQVNFIEAPPAESIDYLKSKGMVIKANSYPHIWPYILRIAGPNTPLADVRVRQALNLAINRDDIVALLGGMAIPAQGLVLPESPWFGHPSFKVRYDPKAAIELLAQAGYTPAKPLKLRFMIAPSGSGQMQPLPMNELVQQQLKAVGVDLSFDVVEWNALRNQRGSGPLDPGVLNVQAINNSMGTGAPYDAFQRLFSCNLLPPAGLNWSGICDPTLQALLDKAAITFDPAEQDKLLAQAHERIVDQAYWLWIVHDVNPRALRPEVKGFLQAKSWYQDLTQVHIE